MLNNRSVLLLFCMQWMLTEIHCDRFCDQDSKPVVDICQENRVTNKEVVFVDSGGVPKAQSVSGCLCDIKAMSLHSTVVWNLELVNDEHLKDDMKFSVGDNELDEDLSVTRLDGIVKLMYSKLSDSSVGGGCVRITTVTDVIGDTKPKFSVSCKANKLTKAKGTAALSNGQAPDSGSDVTLMVAAIGGGMAVIAIVVVVAVFIIWRRKRNINDPDPTEQDIKSEQYEDTTNYGRQPNPAYEQFEGNKQNKTGAEYVYEEHYAVPDDTQHVDGHKKSEYDYAECEPSPTSNNTPANQEQNLPDNTYDHTTTTSTSTGSIGASENEYNHLPPSVTQKSELDNYNTLDDIKGEPTVNHTDSEYNVLSHSTSSFRGNS